MSVQGYLLIAVTILGWFVEADTLLPVNEVKGCFEDATVMASTRRCFTKECRHKSLRDAVVPCTKLGYDLIYEDSSYNHEGDTDVYQKAHCAIEKCADGIMKLQHSDDYDDDDDDDDDILFGVLSGIAGGIQSCLYAMKDCMKKQKVEL